MHANTRVPLKWSTEQFLRSNKNIIVKFFQQCLEIHFCLSKHKFLLQYNVTGWWRDAESSAHKAKDEQESHKHFGFLQNLQRWELYIINIV